MGSMPVDLEQQILKVLRGMRPGQRPATIGDLSRQLGVTSQIISGCIRRMVESGSAQPSMIPVRGVPTLHGLLGQPVERPVAVETAADESFVVVEPA